MTFSIVGIHGRLCVPFNRIAAVRTLKSVEYRPSVSVTINILDTRLERASLTLRASCLKPPKNNSDSAGTKNHIGLLIGRDIISRLPVMLIDPL